MIYAGLRKIAYDTSWSDIINRKTTKGSSADSLGQVRKHFEGQLLGNLSNGGINTDYFHDVGSRMVGDKWGTSGGDVRSVVRHADVVGPSSRMKSFYEDRPMTNKEFQTMQSGHGDYDMDELDNRFKSKLGQNIPMKDYGNLSDETAHIKTIPEIDLLRQEPKAQEKIFQRKLLRDATARQEVAVLKKRQDRLGKIKQRKAMELLESERAVIAPPKVEAPKVEAPKVEAPKVEARTLGVPRGMSRSKKMLLGAGGLTALGGAGYIGSRMYGGQDTES